MVVLASDTITAPLLPRAIHFSQQHTTRRGSAISGTTSKNNIANNWSTKTKIIFAVCVAVAILLVLALALFLQCRRRRRERMNNNNRSSMERIAENQGYGGYNLGLVQQLSFKMDAQEEEKERERMNQQKGNSNNMMYYGATKESAVTPPARGRAVVVEDDDEGTFENVSLEGSEVTPTKPGGIYRYGDRKSRFSP